MSPAEPAGGESDSPAAAPGAEPSADEERQSTPFLVLQFFIFPMAIVAVCVTVFVVFGLIAAEGKGAREYLDEIRTGGSNRRWQAAFELSRLIQSGGDPELEDPLFVAQALSLFEDAERDDPKVRRYLALALGRLGDRRAVPLLRQAAIGSDDAETRIFATWALGSIGDPAAVDDLLALAGADDVGLRKTAVHALGGFAGEAGPRAALVAALEDGVADVRWNAAVGLARAGDPRAIPVLRRMLDREQLAAVPEITPPQVESALLEAVTAAAALGSEELRQDLERLGSDDPSLKVRESARVALGSLQEASAPAP
jgi:HEAT repeat protein